MGKKAIIIGAGFSGISTATHLAANGFEVLVLEKNETLGGRARTFTSENGFVFDMGPSWYWMPDVFENHFAAFGKKVSDYYTLKRLDPSYQVFFEDGDVISLPAKMEALEKLFEQLEPGSTPHLRKFLKEAAYKYTVGMNEFVNKPSHSIFEFADWRVLKSFFQLDMFTGMSEYVARHFKNNKLRQIIEFPVLFLGATPKSTPALYSLMNHADLTLGTWYPMGGMHKIIEGMISLAIDEGVRFQTGKEVAEILTNGNVATGIKTKSGEIVTADVIVGSADYNHVDTKLLQEKDKNYSEKYWDTRVMAPSSLLFYLGVNKRLKNLVHHNLFFDSDFNQHAHEIYDAPQWPSAPLFYASVPSITDASVAPAGYENLFLLIPIAPNLEDSDALREKYYNVIMERLEKRTGQTIRDSIIYKRSYCLTDFQDDYHAYKGNAYGLANTLLQTAFLKPKLKNKHLRNFWYAGQLTTPGPGVPPSIISGKVAADDIIKQFKMV